MKDYRKHDRRYDPREWERDDEWLANRLEFLWTFADYYSHLYIERRLCEEKNDIYKKLAFDQSGVMHKASKMHYEQYDGYKQNVEKFKETDSWNLIKDFDTLMRSKINDMDNFLRKRLYIKYYYLEQYFIDYNIDEFREYCSRDINYED